MIVNEGFGSTSKNVSYDHAGNLIDDGRFQYVYDAWNRLIKVRSAVDTDVTFQTAEFFADGRRAKKVVTNSAPYDRAEVYFYDGQKIIETRDGSGNVKQQFIHGTLYIDELIMMRAIDKGDLDVHLAPFGLASLAAGVNKLPPSASEGQVVGLWSIVHCALARLGGAELGGGPTCALAGFWEVVERRTWPRFNETQGNTRANILI